MVEIDETPDSTRPRNVWPRLFAFGLLLLAVGVGIVACVAAFANSVPRRTLTVPVAELEPGVPRLLPVTTWGADRGGNTFGAWVVVLPNDGGTRAFLSRDPSSGCQVQWKIVVEGGAARGVFVDYCNPTVRYGPDGAAVDGATRGLDRFDLSVKNGQVIVPIDRVQLGPCPARNATPAAPCSSPGSTRFQDLPAGPLAGIAGYRQQATP